MTWFARLLPQPLVSVVILGVWLVLAPAISLGHFLLAAILAVAIPILTSNLWFDRPRLVRPWVAVLLFARVMGDIVVANWQVARLVLGPLDRLRPAFIEIPLDVADPFVATLLGSIISLTPGTVSVEIDRPRSVLLVHALDVDDRDAMIATIKNRYEAPLKEIFRC
ncbi:MAG: Na+/H+ antiporter subunit E [Enhydrobacter sp.]|nr:MAG: Na+/H+ antiporter subunit E [Enhydrobacter sp.]